MECKSGAKQSRRGRTLPVSAAAALLLAGCMTPVPAPGAPYTVATQTNLAYGPLAAERGDLYLPQGIAAPPVVLVIHGGGWAAGQRASAAGLARLLAMRGLAAFNIDYRLATTASPDTRWPAQIVDAQLAVRWLRAHAATLGIDGQQIAATGDSAGAHLALLLGTLPHSVPGDEAGLFPDQAPNVSAVADQFGPTDMATLPPWVIGLYPLLFGTQNPSAQTLAAMSVLPALTPHSAPVLIVQGDTDVIVPPAQSLRLQEALRQQGVAVDYVRYPGGHGYEGLDGKTVFALQQQIATWLVAHLEH